MNDRETVHQDEHITITKRNVFGKIGLSGHNKTTGATVTAFVANESEIEEKIPSMIYELNKENVQIDLTSRISKIENKLVSL